jgi:multiple sugar transport system permease protein
MEVSHGLNSKFSVMLTMPINSLLPRFRHSHAPAGRPFELSERAWSALFTFPALLLITLLALVPIAGAIWLSLRQYLPIFQINEFVGLRNFVRLGADDRFWAACRTTLYFTGVSVGLELLLGLIIALLLHGALHHKGGISTGKAPAGKVGWMGAIVLLPWIIPTVVSARAWEWLYQPEYGLLNYVLQQAGIIETSINWLGNPVWAMHGAILMDVWKATPFAAILLFAGLRAIPPELYWAARVDGAGAWATFRYVTLPLLMPVILIVLTFRTMDAFRVFDAVYVLTGGGPGNATETLSIYAYKMLFQTMQFGYGSALACMMFALIACVTVGYLLLLRRRLEVL